MSTSNEITARQLHTATGTARVGDIVQFVGRRRRFVVTSIDRMGTANLVALSGGYRGSAPSGIVGAEVAVVDSPAELVFTGKDARRLASRARQAFHLSCIDIPLDSKAERSAFVAVANELGERIQ